jgi:hypothetical protein
MNKIPREVVWEHMRTLFELYDLSEKMMLQVLKRRHPGETPAQIEKRLVAWLQERPGAEHGDGPQPAAGSRTAPKP